MSTYVLMRLLESAPHRYDLGIRLLTFGRLERAYDRLASHVGCGQRVLDIGCGTGALALRAARRGAKVKGIDVNAEMLEIARERVRQAGLEQSVELVEMGVAELDSEESESYDAVMSGLCFSELSENELTYTLIQVHRILKSGGHLLLADEVTPRNVAFRIINWAVRIPLAALTYLITQQTTRPLLRIPEYLARANLSVVSEKLSALQSLVELVALKPAGGAA